MADLPDELAACAGFQWDKGNSEKNWETHQVTRLEAEQVFFNRPVLLFQTSNTLKPSLASQSWGKPTPHDC